MLISVDIKIQLETVYS